MTLAVADRVRETTTTEGTNTLALLGPVTGHQSFAAIGNGNTTFYGVVGRDTDEWEIGIGTYNITAETLARTTVLSSSEGGTTKVTFSAGVKDVFCTQPAIKSLVLPNARSVYGNSFDGSADLTQVIASTYGGTGNGFAKFTGPTTSEKIFTLPNVSATLLYSGGDLGAPDAGDLINCTFPTLNQSTTGNAATATTLATPRTIYGNSFNGSAALTQVIASTYGGTGNGFAKFSGPSSTEKTFSLPNSNATLLYDGGPLGTPASGLVTNLTGTAAININGTVGATTPATGKFTTANLSAAHSTTTYGGQLYLSGATGNRIDFNSAGAAPPATVTRSIGAKIVYFGTTPGAEYATGIESGAMWNASSATTSGFKWYGGTTLAASLTGTGGLSLADKITITGANNTDAGEAQINLNGATGNRIDFPAVGFAPPSVTTRSVGTKLLLWPLIDTLNTDYALGVDANSLWSSVPNTTCSFKWYVKDAEVLSVNGSGIVSSKGNVIAGLSANTGQFVATQGSASTWYAAMLRNDGANVQLLSSSVQTTEALARAATYNAFRPFLWNLTTGAVSVNSSNSGATSVGGTQVNLNAATVVTGALSGTTTVAAGTSISAGTSIAAVSTISSNANITAGTSISAGTSVTATTHVIAGSTLNVNGVLAPGATYHLGFGGGAQTNIGSERNPTANTAGNNTYLIASGASAGATDKNAGSLMLRSGVSTGSGTGAVQIQTSVAGTPGTGDSTYQTMVSALGNKLGFYGATPVVKAAAPTAAVAIAPSGGTGTAAGGWDTAAHRDTAIAAINNLMTRVAYLESVITALGLTA